MAVAPASMADKIIILDDDEEESPQSSHAVSTSPTEHQAQSASPLKAQPPAPTSATQSHVATAKKHNHVLQAENERLFTEFIEHCSAQTQDCPEVLSFLHTKHAKASHDYLSSVEFRNTLSRCLTRARANRSKTFVYINELCTVLRQHAVKKRQTLTKVEPKSSTSSSSNVQSTSVLLESKDKEENGEEVEGKKPAEEDEQPSTSGLQEGRENNKEEQQDAEKKANRTHRRQIAYLENLLKVYNNEICRLQQAELNLDDLAAEDSLYIQEHKLKSKMMKIYEKLCELKGCNKLTGRVIEQRITYKGSRYPEINRKIERFINSPEVQRNPPDYQDILQQVMRANERHKLCLSRKQLTQTAQEAFRETWNLMQERRHLDLVYNFGSHLTDSYKPACDPALSDALLLQKLRSNREVALSHLDEVITKYANKQEDIEEMERSRRLGKEGNKSEKDDKSKKVNGVKEEDEELEEEDDDDDDDDDEEEEDSSDPDIEVEIQASTLQDGPDDDEDKEENGNEAEQAGEANREDQTDKLSGSTKDEEEEPVTSGLGPLSEDSKSQTSLSDSPSLRDSPFPSEPTQSDNPGHLSNGTLLAQEDTSVDTSVQVSDMPEVTEDPAAVSPVVTNGKSSPLTSAVTLSDMQTSIGTSLPPSPQARTSQKRKREEIMADNSCNTEHMLVQDSEADLPLDVAVYSGTSPEAIRADTPTQDLVSSSQSTPPPKKNKVSVATQCDPHEIIVLSDSD